MASKQGSTSGRRVSPPPKPPSSSSSEEVIEPEKPPSAYGYEHLPWLEERSGKATMQHLVSALTHVVDVLERARIPYGVMGGVGMRMLGRQNRTTKDIDMAVEVGVIPLLKLLEKDDRIYRPRAISITGSGVAKIFVLVPLKGDNPIPVEVDLILNGNLGAPASLQNAVEARPLGSRRFAVLKLQHIFQAKLRAFSHRESHRDLGDLEWMCVNHEEAIKGFAKQLNANQRAFLAREYVGRNRKAFQGICATLNLDPDAVERSFRSSSSSSSSDSQSRSSGKGKGWTD